MWIRQRLFVNLSNQTSRQLIRVGFAVRRRVRGVVAAARLLRATRGEGSKKRTHGGCLESTRFHVFHMVLLDLVRDEKRDVRRGSDRPHDDSRANGPKKISKIRSRDDSSRGMIVDEYAIVLNNMDWGRSGDREYPHPHSFLHPDERD